MDPMDSYEKLAKNYENFIFDHWINRAIGIHYFQQKQDSLGEYYLGQSLRSENLDLPTKQPITEIWPISILLEAIMSYGAYLDSLLKTLPEETLSKKGHKEKEITLML